MFVTSNYRLGSVGGNCRRPQWVFVTLGGGGEDSDKDRVGRTCGSVRRDGTTD